jgi:signal transduction histidine kinase
MSIIGRTSLPSQLIHDLRSPLNQIIGYSEMMGEDEEGLTRESVVNDAQQIRAAGLRILALLEENFTSGTENDPASVDEDDAEVSAAHRAVVAPGTLLVIDDDENNRDVLSRRLVRQGHVVTVADSGMSALMLMQGTAFDVVLLDIMMPDMDGYAVLHEIKNDPSLQHIPVIMISALNEVQSVVRCIEAGADDYLTKPFNPVVLKARIGACLDRKRGHDRETALYAQLQDNFRRLQEMETLRDDMRNMIVHDLRTPLTAVIMGVGMLEKVGDLSEAQRELMSIAVGSGHTLLGMINDLLDVEKMEAGATSLQVEDLTVEELVSAAISSISSIASSSSTELVSEIAPSLPTFRGDRNLLSRTLSNLLGNAIRFTRGGCVTIGATADASTICFEVRDNGSGIPPEAFERIFEKFGQVDSHSRVGTGLGLAFCRLAVEAHGGRIRVESIPGEGSRFSFSVPLRDANE